MNQPEIHLFCIWKKGLPFAESIVEEIKKDLTVLTVTDIVWKGQSSVKSLFRFYTNPKWIIFWKYLRCGGAPVRMIVVRDDTPRYEKRQTNSGLQEVNTKMFDTKMRLRKMLKNGHWIHATNSPFEFAFNWAMLTGKPADIRAFETQPPWEGTITSQEVVPPGKTPWKDLKTMFDILKPMGHFVVLRNFQNLPESCQYGPHSDIDILSDAPEEIVRLLDLKRASRLPFRAVWRAEAGSSWINIDLRSPGDGYYPAKMAERLLENAVLHNGIPVPCPEDHFYALLYHAAIHKYRLSEEYQQRLLAMAEKLGMIPPAGSAPKEFLARVLHNWMQQQKFEFTEPADLTVNFNPCYLPGKHPVSFKRKIRNMISALLGRKSTI